MASKCRCCGTKDDLTISLDDVLMDKITFLELMQYVCQLKLDNDPNLPRKVCKDCHIRTMEFSTFMDIVAEQQIQVEETKQIVNAKITEEQQAMIKIEASLILVVQEAETTDESSDASTTEQTEERSDEDNFDGSESEETSHHFNLRSKIMPDLKECEVCVERLNIVFVKSDAESEESSSDTVNKTHRSKKTVKKRKFSNPISSENQSPAKRMRIYSPIKVKPEQQKTAVVSVISLSADTAIPHFKEYHKLFKEEFAQKFDASKYNLQQSGKELEVVMKNSSNGSIVDKFAKSFITWESLQSKCIHKQCTNAFLSPYKLLLHSQKQHPNGSKKQFQCLLCPTEASTFKLLDYQHHVVESHDRFHHLRYCCMVCSKMFYNFTALFYHYQSDHRGFFSAIFMCLYDGFLFKSWESLESHVSRHGTVFTSISTLPLPQKTEDENVDPGVGLDQKEQLIRELLDDRVDQNLNLKSPLNSTKLPH